MGGGSLRERTAIRGWRRNFGVELSLDKQAFVPGLEDRDHRRASSAALCRFGVSSHPLIDNSERLTVSARLISSSSGIEYLDDARDTRLRAEMRCAIDRRSILMTGD